jgi:hypothetical protein
MLEDSSVKVLPSRIHESKGGDEGLWRGEPLCVFLADVFRRLELRDGFVIGQCRGTRVIAEVVDFDGRGSLGLLD